uniref:Neurotransmitter-gated ion-channel ligand-binding domain-containing protein n=1 Tax=viral metagenome TaxID=1070528 RepID=A0A6C0EHZ4_9ZZZZ
MKTLLCVLFSLWNTLHFQKVDASRNEVNLRSHLFDNYQKDTRPVKNVSHPLNVDMGLAIQTLEQFNQKTETIKLNIWFRMNWYNAYLNWENKSDEYQIDVIDVSPNTVWTPDIELINAAALPEIYTLKGGMMLYKDGGCMWSRPGIFMFSCPLDLHLFPFDTQVCSLTFSSWIFSNRYLVLKPYDDESKAVDILNDFSHSEWNVKNVSYITDEMPIGNNEFKSTITYSIELGRFTHYYTLTMGMTITLVYISFLIMFLPPNNISRTSTAVFIPLTILALQLTIIDKVPVVGYFTLMDKFFLCCFVSSMLVSMVSAVIFALISHKSHKVLYLISFLTNIDTLRENEMKHLNKKEILSDKLKQRCKEHDSKHINEKTNLDYFIEKDYYEENEPNIENEIMRSMNVFNSSKNLIKNNNNNNNNNNKLYRKNDRLINFEKEDIDIGDYMNNPIYKINSDSHTSSSKISYNSFTNDINSTQYNTPSIIKTINHDNKLLDLSNDELLIYKYMINKIKHIDNFLRVIFPLAYTIYISILLKV